MSKGALGLLSAYWPEDTPRYAHIPLKTVGDVTIHEAAQAAPGQTSLVGASARLSYSDLSAQVKQFGGAIRARAQRGARIAIALGDAAQMIVAAFGAFEADCVAFLSDRPLSADVIAAFAADLIIADENLVAPNTANVVRFDDLLAGETKEKSGRSDFRSPILALPMPDRRGEALHSHRSLAATAISVGKFYLLAEDINVWLLEPPTEWCALAMMLGAFQRGATVWAGWEKPTLPDRIDYVVCGWNRAQRLLDDPIGAALAGKIAAGLIVSIEGAFSSSRRLRLARKLGTDVLTALGRNDLGPVVASHPAWFLNDAAGIPLPNVDLRPLNPADGVPLSIGWEVVDSAEIGVKSALAPVGGMLVEGWLRSGTIAQIDPTGLYFLSGGNPLRVA
jgi:acyl-CoA synthetase (AMP-forming)/AMP-acid ligase II